MLNSTRNVNLLKRRIVEAKERGEGVWITVKRRNGKGVILPQGRGRLPFFYRVSPSDFQRNFLPLFS